MILNLLLTFSQSEREMIADRIRDSVQARKRHGQWPGGLPPFGYNTKGGGLEIVDQEANIVRLIFAEFLRCGTYMGIKKAAQVAGLCSSVKSHERGRLSRRTADQHRIDL